METSEVTMLAMPMAQHDDLDIADIKIGGRYRKDLGDIVDLAASIKRQGLLQPVGVNENNELVFGERRIRAFQHLGWSRIPVRRVSVTSIVEGEHDENEVRKDFTPSERVAILEAISPPNGGDRKSDQKQNFVSDRHEAALKAGFGNYETARQAKTVVASGTPELVEAMDSGKVSISAAATISKQDVEAQKRIVAEDNMARKAAELRAAEAELARVKSIPKPTPKTAEEKEREKAVFGTVEDRLVWSSIDEVLRIVGEQPAPADAVSRIPPSLSHAIDSGKIRHAAAWLHDFANEWERKHVD